MPITADKRPRPLHQYNQLLDAERAQVPPPANETEPRYFGYGTAIYDVTAFTRRYDGLWETDATGKMAVQRLPDNAVLIGVIK
jgi:hypothetical protein